MADFSEDTSKDALETLYTTGSLSLPAQGPRKGPSLWRNMKFHWGNMACVRYTSHHAKRGTLDAVTWRRGSYGVVDWVNRCGVDIEVTGFEVHRDVKGPVVYVSNHMSLLETFMLPALVLRRNWVTYVVKKALFDVPVFGHIMRAIGAIGVTRTDAKADFKTVMREGQARLAEGRSVIIFPQATRDLVFRTQVFNSMGIKLAKKAGVPVIPVALKTDSLKNGKFLKDFGPFDAREDCKIVFGKAVDPQSNPKEAHQAVVDFITGNLSRWGIPVEA